jgi:DNA-directed RNA polymerase specialized sigma24 family protein
LDDDKRIAFVLHEVEQLTLREVAEATEVPIQTAYSRLQAARDFVRQAFAADAPPKGGIGETG